MNLQSEDVEKFRQRFAHLMGDEQAAWKMPASPTPVKVPEASPSSTEVAEGGRPLLMTAADQDDDYDSDDPEQVCNARFATKAPKTQRRNLPSHNVIRQQTSAVQPANPSRLEQLQSRVFANLGLRIGQRANSRMTFAPWKLVVEYPYMFIGRANFDKSYPYFTVNALFDATSWDFFYLHNPRETYKPPFVFVPTDQFEHLLKIVNCILSIELRIPGGVNDKKFRLTFGDLGTPQPKYLGRAQSPKEYEILLDMVPNACPDDLVDNVSPQAAENFLQQLKNLFRAGSSKKKKNDPAEALAKRILQLKTWGRTTKRIQRYLGLRHRNVPGRLESKTLDVLEPAPFPFEKNIVFVAIDVEAYERNNNLITEVGIATLDVQDLRHSSPGDRGKGWFSKIQARHLRVKENSWAVNREFVVGCPTLFDFGESEFVEEKHMVSAIRPMIERKVTASILNQQGEQLEERSVVLVFHDPAADIAYLDQLGYDVYAATNIVEIVDTRTLHQHLRHRPNPTKLQSVLADLDIQCHNLHNAGNDAVYTLQAMVAIAVQQRFSSLLKQGEGRGDHSTAKEPGKHEYYLGSEADGWETGGEGSDGGSPATLEVPSFKPKTRQPRPHMTDSGPARW